MKRLFYPAVFQPEDEGGYSVFFPDVPGCNTDCDDMEEGYEMAFDALGLMLSYMIEQKEELPSASNPNTIKLEDKQFLVVIEFSLDAYRKKHNSKAVKKTLSIPEWLNEEAMAMGINFSQVLQEALIAKLQTR